MHKPTFPFFSLTIHNHRSKATEGLKRTLNRKRNCSNHKQIACFFFSFNFLLVQSLSKPSLRALLKSLIKKFTNSFRLRTSGTSLGTLFWWFATRIRSTSTGICCILNSVCSRHQWACRMHRMGGSSLR
jgi:hypothetical protein